MTLKFVKDFITNFRWLNNVPIKERFTDSWKYAKAINK